MLAALARAGNEGADVQARTTTDDACAPGRDRVAESSSRVWCV